MAMCWTPLSKISTDRDNWTIKVRVLRMWDAINTKNNEFISLDMIFIDEEGSTIHAIVRKNQARTFRPQLLEGRVYTVKNFRVESTKGEFRPMHNDIRIWFMTITTNMESNEDMNSIQKYCFEFADYDQIQNQCYNYTYLIDVVGKLVAVGNVEEPQVNGAPRKLRNLQLLLKEGKEIRLSLWGTSVWQIDEDVYKNNPGPFVLIATSTIVKSFGGKFSLSSTSATKVHLNLEIPEDGFENYTVAKIFDAPSNEKKIPMQSLSDNKSATVNFVRSSQESSSAISSMINTNDATKGENDKSSQIEQIRIDQTSNVEDEETDDDNIPINMLYKR
ncbi:replication protein A 70 kDa DNA-binding subunit D-like [Quercus robur]|uniref:replication protein A 70 kDa DNA-binding subunit D-like n=1 Tax=Quercus robur TaxID=38942 RepID=UPI002163077C|nr:replication protein A 70 kDa DNA-binding subunit D-like [Quercus robur]